MSNKEENLDWDRIVTPTNDDISLKDKVKKIWHYRDLLFLFVKRDIVAMYKQTILGPIWFVIQPIITTVVFTIIFGSAAGLGTDGIPKPLFYLSGIILWNYFADMIIKTGDTFTTNRAIFSKVYFPRVIVPLSVLASNFIKFGIQAILLLCVYLYYYFQGFITPTAYLFLFPLIVIIIGLLGLGSGLFISTLTTKYRDLKFLLQFGIDLLKYASTIIFPLTLLLGQKVIVKYAIFANPMSSIIETFRFGLFGQGEFFRSEPGWMYLGYSALFAVLIFLIGFRIFTKEERHFIDTV